LWLHGVENLDAETAVVLATFKGENLDLSGLTELDEDAANALANSASHTLHLRGLKTINSVIARALSGFKGRLWLDGVTAIDADTARALTEFKGQSIALRGLAEIDAKTANMLSGVRGGLVFGRLGRLSSETARALAAYDGEDLSLTGLTSIDTPTAEILGDFKGHRLWMPSRAFAAIGDTIPLNVKTARLTLTCVRSERIALKGVLALDMPDAVTVATILAQAEHELALPNLERVSPKTLTTLLKNKSIKLPPLDKLEFIKEPDGSHSEDFVLPGDYDHQR
jgi:hypothetical protein